jgi:hypothetical protein
MAINVSQFLAWASEQPDHPIYERNPETGEPLKGEDGQPVVERTIPFMDYVRADDDRFMAAFSAYKEARKKEQATGGDSSSTSSVSYLVTVDGNGELVRADAYSFGKGKSTELDALKLRHDIAVEHNPGATTLGFRLDTTALEALTEVIDGERVLSDLAEAILCSTIQTKAPKAG